MVIIQTVSQLISTYFDLISTMKSHLITAEKDGKRKSKTDVRRSPRKKLPLRQEVVDEEEEELVNEEEEEEVVHETEEQEPLYGVSEGSCLGTTRHEPSAWMDLTEYEDNAYIKPNGRFFGRSCGCCKGKFVEKNPGPGLAFWGRDKPGRVCMVCLDYVLCYRCYLGWLNKDNKRRSRRN
jgi:hypothetical protein